LLCQNHYDLMDFTTPGESELWHRQDNRKASHGHQDVAVIKERTRQPRHAINLRVMPCGGETQRIWRAQGDAKQPCAGARRLEGRPHDDTESNGSHGCQWHTAKDTHSRVEDLGGGFRWQNQNGLRGWLRSSRLERRERPKRMASSWESRQRGRDLLLNCGQTPRTFIAWRSEYAVEGCYKALGVEVESKAMLGGVRGRNRQRLAAS